MSTTAARTLIRGLHDGARVRLPLRLAGRALKALAYERAAGMCEAAGASTERLEVFDALAAEASEPDGVTWAAGGAARRPAHRHRSAPIWAAVAAIIMTCSMVLTPPVAEAQVAPTLVAATPGNGQVALRWTDVPGDERYVVQIKGGPNFPEFGGVTVTPPNDTDHLVDGLVNGTTYTFRVSTNLSPARWSNELRATPRAAPKPGTPTNVRAKAGNLQATLSWTAASHASSYQYRQGTTSAGTCTPSGAWHSAGASSPTTVTSLANGTRYCFAVRARNGTLPGDPSALAHVTPNGPPPVPTNVAAQGRNAQVVLSWTASPNATGYDFQQKTATGACGTGSYGTWTSAGAASTKTVAGLTNAARYCFRVRATNPHGRSDPSPAVDATPNAGTNASPVFTSSATPSVVENQTAVVTVAASDADTSDSVSGYAITGGADRAKFRITSPGGVLTFASAPDFESPADVLSTTPANPAGNNEYVVVVQVTSGTGARALTADQTIVVTVTDLSDVPPVPANVSAQAGIGQAVLRWNASPTAASYEFQHKTANGSAACGTDGYGPWMSAGAAPSKVVAGLTNDTRHCFRVRARNAVGPSGPSAAVDATPSARAPTGLRAEPGDGQVTLRWTAVPGADGYWVKIFEGRQTQFRTRLHELAAYGTDEEEVVTGLTNGTTYTFLMHVRTSTWVEQGSWWRWTSGPDSAPVTATPMGPPSGACGGEALTANGSVSGRWSGRYTGPPRGWVTDCPSLKRGEKYAARYYRLTLAAEARITLDLSSPDANPYLYLWEGASRRGGTPLASDNDGGSGWSARIDRSLAAGTYTVEATTHGDLDDGRFTLTVGGLGGSAPDAVASVDVTHNGTSLSVSWAAPARAALYDVVYSDDGGRSWTRAAWQRAGTSLTIAGADAAKSYIVGVRARNASGALTSAWTNSAPAAYEEPDSPEPENPTWRAAAPTSLSVVHRGTRLEVSWAASARATGYDVTYYNHSTGTWARGAWERAGTSLTISRDSRSGHTNLIDSGATYTVGVRARNAVCERTTPVLGCASDWVNSQAAAPPALSVGDASVREPAAGTANLNFTVTLAPASSGTVTVDYTTADGTATAPGDYTATSGTLTFSAGQTSRTVAVPVLADAHDEGSETLTFRLSNASGARIVRAQASGSIHNEGGLQRQWLARFGRAVAGQMVEALEGRFAMGLDTPSHLTIAGRRVDFSGAPPAPEGWEDGWEAGETHGMDLGELLLGSSFHLTTGDALGAGAMTGWGKALAGSSSAALPGGLAFTSETVTGVLGMDVERDDLLLGFALSQSAEKGGASFASTGDEYGLDGTLSLVTPYARWRANERLSLWGMAGSGAGHLAFEHRDARLRTDLAMRMVAAGARADLLRPDPEAGGFALALKTDAFFVRTESESVSRHGVGNLGGDVGDASRVRAVLEGSRAFSLSGGGSVEPSLSLGLRHDGGDAETGTGVEMGAGLAWSDPSIGLTSDLRLYGLAAHEDESVDEWGVSGSLRIEPGASGQGLSLSMTPTWGAQGQSGRVWDTKPSTLVDEGDDTEPQGARIDTELGYGLSLSGGLTGTPYVGLGWGETRDYRLGWRLASGRWQSFSLGLEAARHEATDDGAPEHRIGVQGRLRW